ncbi:hypothetical protein L9F63_003362 [Diploptera punctata]|uniref:Nicastrin n=1 Tax=Diploptera punctata TaxID=6984 RepID=A0AAD7ZLS5_DIPPU|nr:hypothetical protein L9F63_003362 [Diploptera punctata]
MLLHNVSASLLFLTVIFASIYNVSLQRIRDKMYEPIEGASACFRRLNGTHQFGCSSHRSGNVGVLQFVDDDMDLNWLVENATVSPYMAVLPPKMFTKDVLLKLKTSGKVNGVVLINNGTETRPEHFSHEDKCPNRYSGLSLVHEQTCNISDPWNVHGTGISLIDWGFPIFHVKDEDNISKLYQCYKTHNAHDRDAQVERSLCALEMNSFMLAAVDSKTCIRRSSATTILNRVRYCDPLGDRNIWSTLYPRYKAEEKNKTVIVVAARMDGTSMFDGIVPGAISPISGIVTLLMTARILAKLAEPLDEQHGDDNVMFVLLNGESYDYIGSSRLVWDMTHGVFPISPNSDIKVKQPPFYLHNIKLFVELGQISTLGNVSSSETDFYLHQYEPSSNRVNSQNVISSFKNKMNNVSQNIGLKFKDAKKKNSFPPSSLQSVLAKSPDIEGVVLTDHESHYLNTYYHSIMDDSSNLKYVYQNGSTPSEDSIQTVIAKLSRSLAMTLYYMISNENKDPPELEAKMVDELLHCYLDTMDCPVFRAISYKQKLDDKPASLYVGVNVWLSPITTLTGHALALLVNQTDSNKTEETCYSDVSNRVFSYIWMHNIIDDVNSTGACIKTTMNFSSAISPAFFEEQDYDWSSGNYSTWTESIWREFSVRMFLKPSKFHENLTFALGVVVLALSFLIVYFANSKSHILFGNTFVENSC